MIDHMRLIELSIELIDICKSVARDKESFPETIQAAIHVSESVRMLVCEVRRDCEFAVGAVAVRGGNPVYTAPEESEDED